MAKIKYGYAVIYDGVFYRAGEEIEVKEPKTTDKEVKGEEKAVIKNDKRTSKKSKSRTTN